MAMLAPATRVDGFSAQCLYVWTVQAVGGFPSETPKTEFYRY